MKPELPEPSRPPFDEPRTQKDRLPPNPPPPGGSEDLDEKVRRLQARLAKSLALLERLKRM